MWGDDSYRILVVQIHADTGGELWPRRHAFFEGAKRRNHLLEIVGEPVVHRGLVCDLPLQRRKEGAKAAFKIGILLRAASSAIEVDDIHVFKPSERTALSVAIRLFDERTIATSLASSSG